MVSRITLLLVLTAATCSLANAQKKGGWVSLFDGKTTKGWHTFNKQEVGSNWKVQDGALFMDATSSDHGDIITDAAYENFHLKLEWKISKGGNSGIMFNVLEDVKYKYPWLTGPEMQVLDNDGHADAKIFKHRAGDLYDLVACSEEVAKPVGDWNLAEIICNKGTLELKLNGKTVVVTSYGDEAWKKMVAGSKFKSMPDFAMFSGGKISLQDHGNDVWFRNIKIKQL